MASACILRTVRRPFADDCQYHSLFFVFFLLLSLLFRAPARPSPLRLLDGSVERIRRQQLVVVVVTAGRCPACRPVRYTAADLSAAAVVVVAAVTDGDVIDADLGGGERCPRSAPGTGSHRRCRRRRRFTEARRRTNVETVAAGVVDVDWRRGRRRCRTHGLRIVSNSGRVISISLQHARRITADYLKSFMRVQCTLCVNLKCKRMAVASINLPNCAFYLQTIESKDL